MLKVIVVGGGPVGLIAAHALSQAGIDFVVLERSAHVALDLGASLVLGPQSLRVMHQLGLLDDLLAIGGEFKHTTSFLPGGQKVGDSTRVQSLRENFGISLVSFHRAELVQTLYDLLPANAKLQFLLGKKVTGVECDSQGARVHCADDSIYEGSLVIGADGVHSKVRNCMRGLALRSGDSGEWDSEIPFISEYKCMWCSFPRPLQCGEATQTENEGRSAMFLTGHERGWIFLYEKLAEPTTERKSYTKEEMEDFAASFAEWTLHDSLKVKDVLATKLTMGMANLEEGVLKHWSWSRIVLVGDACHKFTPNAGHGFNNGIQDVVALCNGLHDLACSTPDVEPSAAALQSTFQKYQALRLPIVESYAVMSAHTTRIQAWRNWAYWAISRYVMPLSLVQELLWNYITPRMLRKSLKLNYIASDEVIKGGVDWEHT